MPEKVIGVDLPDVYIVNGVDAGISPWSPLEIVQIPVKTPVPSAPTILSVSAPSETAGTIAISIELPRTNTDGSELYPAEIVKLGLHYRTSPGVTEADPMIEFAPSSLILWAPGDTRTYYIRVRVQDSHGNWSALSNEASGAAHPAPVFVEDLWAHRLGKNSIFTDQSPSPGYVSWSNVTLRFRDEEYAIQDGNTNKKYIWWDYSLSKTRFQTSDTPPVLDKEDVIIGYNDNGKWYLMLYSPMVMADFIRVGVLQSSNWSASEGSQLNLNIGELKIGGSSAPKFSVSSQGILTATSVTITGTGHLTGGYLGSSSAIGISSGGLDVGSTGYVRGGKTGYGSGSGFWLGYSGGYKFDIGDSSRYLRWTGTDLYVTGRVYSEDGSYIRTGTTQRTDINAYSPHRIALIHSSGILGTYIYESGIEIREGSYTPLKLQSLAPHIYFYPYAAGAAWIGSISHLFIESGGNLALLAQNGNFTIEGPSGTLLHGTSSYAYFPASYLLYWYYGGLTYDGPFYTPAMGIYIYIGGSRYAIPVYGPV